MPTGSGSRRKRARNDLDEYLEEVDSLLFCVTRADRQCLHRDLKAHVKAITTDPDTREDYQGMYGITRSQLDDAIGDPRTIASNYIVSVPRRIPSVGLRILAVILGAVFVLSAVVGVERYSVGSVIEEGGSSWMMATGALLALVGVVSTGLLALSMASFSRFHTLVSYLIIAAIVVSVPDAIFVGGYVTRDMYIDTAVVLQNWVGLMFVIDMIAVAIVGLYLYLNHFRVLAPKQDLMV